MLDCKLKPIEHIEHQEKLKHQFNISIEVYPSDEGDIDVLFELCREYLNIPKIEQCGKSTYEILYDRVLESLPRLQKVFFDESGDWRSKRKGTVEPFIIAREVGKSLLPYDLLSVVLLSKSQEDPFNELKIEYEMVICRNADHCDEHSDEEEKKFFVSISVHGIEVGWDDDECHDWDIENDSD